MESLGQKIRSRRKFLGMSQQELANKSGLAMMTIRRYETEEREPTIQTIKKIAHALDVPINYLIPHQSEISGTKNKNIIKIPVYETIPAGVPMEAIEDVLDYEEIPEDWTKEQKEFFGMRVNNLSMEPEYMPGDVVIFEKKSNCKNGDVCAIFVDGEKEAIIRKVQKTENGIILIPLRQHRSAYKVRFFNNESQDFYFLKILGVACELRRKIP